MKMPKSMMKEEAKESVAKEKAEEAAYKKVTAGKKKMKKGKK